MIQINGFWGDLTDVSATTKKLVLTSEAFFKTQIKCFIGYIDPVDIYFDNQKIHNSRGDLRA